MVGLIKPSLRWDNYYGLTHFIVPPIAKEIEEPKKDVKSAPKQSIKKSSIIKVNTNHIKGWTMTKRGRKPKAIVIHNDAGTMNSKQYYNNLVNADYNRLARGIAHAYADRNGIWEAISEDRIAWHVSDGVQPGSGNFETYGIEVNQSLYVSDKDFLKMNKQLLNSQRINLKVGVTS